VVRGLEILYRILLKKQLCSGVSLIEVEAQRVARKAKPGQFVILRVDEKGERIPLTIFEANQEQGTIKTIFQEVGKTTFKLGRLEEGDRIQNVVGPLGKPIEEKLYGNVVIIGGGVGAAEAYPIANALKKKRNHITAILGARSKELLLLEDEFKRIVDALYITTDDGSKGRKGLVTDVLSELIEDGSKIDMVYSIGPAIMMKAVSMITKNHAITTLVSLNPIMVDGTGMCGSCRVMVGEETKFTCVDGPEFDGHKVDFDLLMARQRMYLEAERKSMLQYSEES